MPENQNSTTDLHINQFASDQKDKYNRFVLSHADSNPLQLWEWGEIKGSRSWSVERLGFWEGKKLIGVAQVLKRAITFRFCMYYIPYGPLFDWENEKQAAELLGLLKQYYKENASAKTLFLKIEPRIKETKSVTDILKAEGFVSVTPSVQPKHTAIVDLSKSADEIFSSFEKDTRYSIRRAEREEVGVQIFTNPLNIQPVKEFYSLYKLTSVRGRFVARPLTQFEKMWTALAPENRVAVYEAWFKDKILAAAFVLKLKPKAFLVYAGSLRDESVKNKFPTYLVQWKIIESLKKEGFTSYDLWGISPDTDPTHSWAGHTLFKRGFGGEEITFAGSYDYPLSPLYRVFNRANKLRYFLSKIKTVTIKSNIKTPTK